MIKDTYNLAERNSFEAVMVQLLIEGLQLGHPEVSGHNDLRKFIQLVYCKSLPSGHEGNDVFVAFYLGLLEYEEELGWKGSHGDFTASWRGREFLSVSSCRQA